MVPVFVSLHYCGMIFGCRKSKTRKQRRLLLELICPSVARSRLYEVADDVRGFWQRERKIIMTTGTQFVVAYSI
jgi:hypothetical protein